MPSNQPEHPDKCLATIQNTLGTKIAKHSRHISTNKYHRDMGLGSLKLRYCTEAPYMTLEAMLPQECHLGQCAPLVFFQGPILCTTTSQRNADGLFWLETVYLRQCTEAVYEECHKNIQTPGQQLLSSKREQKIEQRCFCLKGLYFFWSLLVNLNCYQVSIR